MITFDESKRQININKHGIDFIGCDAIWGNFTITREDRRYTYDGEVVVLVYTERGETSHIISLRKAEKYETNYYFATARAYLF